MSTGRDNDSGAFKVLLNGSVETKEIMSYEVQEEYLVCVEVLGTARPTRVKRAFNESQMVPTDRIGYLVIRITDVNDNGPSFPTDSATAGDGRVLIFSPPFCICFCIYALCRP